MNASAGAKAKVVQPERASEQFSHDFLQSHEKEIIFTTYSQIMSSLKDFYT
jgi:hypothetical protein